MWAWNNHRHQLFCALCEFSPDGSEEEGYWGECSFQGIVVDTNTRTVVLCPECLHSPWQLYKRSGMKLATPTFHENSNLHHMLWKMESKTIIPRFLVAEIGLHKQPQSISEGGLLQEVRRLGLNVTRHKITQYLRRPISVYPAALFMDNGHFDWHCLDYSIEKAGHRFRIGPPTVLSQLLHTFIKEEYEKDYLPLLHENNFDLPQFYINDAAVHIKPFTDEEALKHGLLNWDPQSQIQVDRPLVEPAMPQNM